LWPPLEAGWCLYQQTPQAFAIFAYIPLGLANKGCINHPLVFSCFWVERGVQAEGL
jgi:hypothetical protein